jgi:hypothetical protein
MAMLRPIPTDDHRKNTGDFTLAHELVHCCGNAFDNRGTLRSFGFLRVNRIASDQADR